MASRFQPAPIIDASRKLCGDIERVVRLFPRYHRYASGLELRRQAAVVMQHANRAIKNPDQRAQHVAYLVDAVDDLMDRLQVCKFANAFSFKNGFSHFERLVIAIEGLGAQAGGWKRSTRQHPIVQNAQAQRVAQRDMKLSTPAASMPGANP
jgi:hypothetical protein